MLISIIIPMFKKLKFMKILSQMIGEIGGKQKINFNYFSGSKGKEVKFLKK